MVGGRRGVMVEVVAAEVEQADGLVVEGGQVGKTGEHVLVLLEEAHAELGGRIE